MEQRVDSHPRFVFAMQHAKQIPNGGSSYKDVGCHIAAADISYVLSRRGKRYSTTFGPERHNIVSSCDA